MTQKYAILEYLLIHQVIIVYQADDPKSLSSTKRRNIIFVAYLCWQVCWLVYELFLKTYRKQQSFRIVTNHPDHHFPFQRLKKSIKRKNHIRAR